MILAIGMFVSLGVGLYIGNSSGYFRGLKHSAMVFAKCAEKAGWNQTQTKDFLEMK